METSGRLQIGRRRIASFLATWLRPILVSSGMALTLASGFGLDLDPPTAHSPNLVSATGPLWPAVIAPVNGLARNAGKLKAIFGEETASAQTRQMADWIAHSNDNAAAAFFIVDKVFARVYVFDAQARLQASSAVLLGAAIGDDSVPGIGARPISQVLPAERTTPAGRFVAEAGLNLNYEDVIWVDYDAAVSMHRVRASNPAERRLQRLASESVDDNRISYGCINVPVGFYESYLRPTLAMHKVVIYVLPELKSLQQVFKFYPPVQAQQLRHPITGRPQPPV